MKITRFEDIEAWQAAREMQKAVYEATGMKGFASDLDLRRQMRKTAISSMANIAEGFDAGSDPEFRRFLRIARRSATELQSHLYVALDQKLLPQSAFDRLYESAAGVKRRIGGFIRYLEASSKPKK